MKEYCGESGHSVRKPCPRQLVMHSGTPFLADNVTGAQRLDVAHIAGLDGKYLGR